jgi:hypothetical protein
MPTVDRIGAEAFKGPVLRLRQLQHDVEDASLTGSDSQVGFEPVVRDRLDAAGAHAAEVDGNTIGFPMLDGGKNTFT